MTIPADATIRIRLCRDDRNREQVITERCVDAQWRQVGTPAPFGIRHRVKATILADGIDGALYYRPGNQFPVEVED